MSVANQKRFSIATVIKNEKTKVFSFFLLVTVFVWLLVELSKTYNSTQKFEVVFKRIPENLLLEKKTPSKIEVLLISPGFSLLNYKIFGKKLTISLSGVKKNKAGYYLLPNKQLSLLAPQLSDSNISRVVQDTLYVALGEKITKKVSVKPSLDLQFKQGFNIASKGTIIKPAFVTLSGSKNILDTIKSLSTVLYSKKRVNSSVQKKLKLAFDFEKYAVSVTPKDVEVFVDVKKFTEGSVFLPVKIKNIPKGKTIVPYPNQVELIYKSDIENFKKITAKSFAVEYDFKQYLRDNKTSKLSPIIKRKSTHASSIRLVPEMIDFIIEKK